MATYSELADLLNTTVGELSNFASQHLKDAAGNPFPPGVKAVLTNEHADLLIVKYPKYKADLSSRSEAKQLPSSSSIQEANKPEVSPNSSSQMAPHSYLEQARQNLEQARSAQDSQAMEILKNEIEQIQQGSTQIGVLKAILGADAETKGFLLANNAIAQSNQVTLADLLRKKAETLVGGTDFLSPWESPTALDSIAQDTLDQLAKLSKN